MLNEQDDSWSIAGIKLQSRVFLGTAGYPSTQTLLDSLTASGTQTVTVSLRRVKIDTNSNENIYHLLKTRNFYILPNTAGCLSAKEAILTARMAREALNTSWIKLEIIADEKTLLPDSVELLNATKILVKEGFSVFPYCNDDPILAERLQDLGCVAVMPLAAPIGSGLGIRNPHNIVLIKEKIRVPLIIDAGLGTASDITQAFELGCDAVLLNSAVSRSHDPIRMANAVKAAAIAGRHAFLAGRMPRKYFAQSTSSMQGRAW